MTALRTITPAAAAILASHALWLAHDPAGTRADLSDANLRYANLRGANLGDANLRYANLGDANLRYANLRGADLRYANLGDANLRGADLTGADLSGANLWGTDLRGTCLIDGGDDPRGYRFVGLDTADGRRVLAGCRDYSLAEAREHWANNPDALACVEVIAAAP